MPLTASAIELAARLRAREISSEELVELHIERVRAVNPALNAMVQDRFDEARAEARAADARLRGGEADLPPLLGVPCTIKECFALHGMPNTSGLVARKGIVSTDDATAVRRLRDAGAIPLGVTNVSELCMWMESDNRVYGRTGSAYDPGRTAGGSSGGEGALVGAGASPFGLGSDVGGSIRMPAFFNGVFGHKPTGGTVPGSGQYPVATGPALRYLTTGPICRSADDLMPLLRILAGPDGIDSGCEARELGEPADVSLRELVVHDVRETVAVPVSSELADAQELAARALSARGARVVRTKLPALREGIEIWSAMMEAAGGPTYAEILGNGVAVDPLRELGRLALGRSPYTLASIGLAALENLPKKMPVRRERLVAAGERLRREIVDVLGDRGVMLFAPHARVTTRHGMALVPPLRWGYTAVFNVLELPVTQVPLGLSARGLPLGVQVVGTHGADHVTIAVAIALSRALGGWTPPARFPLPRPRTGIPAEPA